MWSLCSEPGQGRMGTYHARWQSMLSGSSAFPAPKLGKRKHRWGGGANSTRPEGLPWDDFTSEHVLAYTCHLLLFSSVHSCDLGQAQLIEPRVSF